MQAKASCDSFLPNPTLSLGDALLDAGESMKRLAEVKDSLDIEVKQNFIDPLQNLCDKDLKEIQVCPHPALPGPDSQQEVLQAGPRERWELRRSPRNHVGRMAYLSYIRL